MGPPLLCNLLSTHLVQSVVAHLTAHVDIAISTQILLATGLADGAQPCPSARPATWPCCLSTLCWQLPCCVQWSTPEPYLHALMHAWVSIVEPKLTYTLSYHAHILTSSAFLGAEIAGSPVLREDFQDFLPHLDGVFELDVTLAEVSNLPHDGQTQVYYERWAACCCTR